MAYLNFLPEGSSVAAFVGASLAALEREHAPAYDLMCRTLRPRSIEIEVDDETLCVDFGSGRSAIVSTLLSPTLRVATRRSTIVRILKNHATIRECLLDGSLDVRGAPADIAVFDSGLDAYVRGAVRSPSFEALYDAFLASG